MPMADTVIDLTAEPTSEIVATPVKPNAGSGWFKTLKQTYHMSGKKQHKSCQRSLKFTPDMLNESETNELEHEIEAIRRSEDEIRRKKQTRSAHSVKPGYIDGWHPDNIAAVERWISESSFDI